MILNACGQALGPSENITPLSSNHWFFANWFSLQKLPQKIKEMIFVSSSGFFSLLHGSGKRTWVFSKSHQKLLPWEIGVQKAWQMLHSCHLSLGSSSDLASTRPPQDHEH